MGVHLGRRDEKPLRRKYEAGDDRSEHRAKIVNKLVGEGFNDDQIYELFGNDNPWVSDYKKLMGRHQTPTEELQRTAPS